jgi:hypothetical protein
MVGSCDDEVEEGMAGAKKNRRAIRRFLIGLSLLGACVQASPPPVRCENQKYAKKNEYRDMFKTLARGP